MITPAEIATAAARLRGRVQPTPLFPSPALSARVGAAVWLKAESLQRTGSFKFRGATNRMSRLSAAERRRGVVAASAGNHAQGVALAASMTGVPAAIFMPRDAPLIKYEKTRGYGAEVRLVDGNIEEAVAAALSLGDREGRVFVHPFDDPFIQAGQGTVGLEILDDCPDAATVVVPVGGGGLLSGIAVAMKQASPGVRLFGVQARGAAPAAASLRKGRPVELRSARTMADGIRVRRIALSTFETMQAHVDDVVTVTDEEISRAMVFLLEKARLVVEGAGAAGVAALLAGRLPQAALQGPLVIVLSGGNADTNLLARVIERGLTADGRYVLLRVRIPDRPGRLEEILQSVTARRANILDITHHRTGWRVPLGDVEIEALLEIRNARHGRQILNGLREQGLDAELLGRRAYRRR